MKLDHLFGLAIWQSRLGKGCCVALLAFMSLLGIAPPVAAQDTPVATYASPDVWLCKPGATDVCSGDLRTTTVLNDGSTSTETLKPDPAAPIDCFFLYPTISFDPAGNSSLVPGKGERHVTAMQFAMFGTVCRPFAPMYRQVTLAGLFSGMRGQPIPMDPELGYRDVVAAWRYYLSVENKGRGVVLVGHSQGSRVLAQLIQREIEGTPAQAQIVSAIIPGYNVEVPSGSDVGGSFKKMPLCKSAQQTGCIISYVTFRASFPPPASARFGRTTTPGMAIACVDPVALSGSAVKDRLPRALGLLVQPLKQFGWDQFAAGLDSDFVSLPGLLDARCVNEGGASYLSVSVLPKPGDRRPTNISSDIVANGKILDDWGLHHVDVNLPMGNLVEIVRKQGAAYLMKR